MLSFGGFFRQGLDLWMPALEALGKDLPLEVTARMLQRRGSLKGKPSSRPALMHLSVDNVLPAVLPEYSVDSDDKPLNPFEKFS